MFSYLAALPLECMSDSNEQLSHYLETYDLFFGFHLRESQQTFVMFASCLHLFGWYSKIAVLSN